MIKKINSLNSQLFIVDVQEKLLPKIDGKEQLLRNTVFLMDCASLLKIPVLATEQYPQGLGMTVPQISQKFSQKAFSKRSFGILSIPTIIEHLKENQRENIILVGIETHICILQTAFDLMESGFNVFIPCDAVSARNKSDSDIALLRLNSAGAILTSSESTIFEWLQTSEHPQFKAISKLVQDRMN